MRVAANANAGGAPKATRRLKLSMACWRNYLDITSLGTLPKIEMVTTTIDDFRITRAKTADAPAIARCVDDAYTHYIERMDKAPGPMTQNYWEVVRAHEVYVARGAEGMLPNNGDTIVGVLVVIQSGTKLLLDNVAVSPVAQGHGLGKRLVTFAEQRAVELGFSEIELYTHAKMTENQIFYPKLGYNQVRRVFENGFERIYYAKKL